MALVFVGAKSFVLTKVYYGHICARIWTHMCHGHNINGVAFEVLQVVIRMSNLHTCQS